jgi:hypothetical protein
MPSACMRAAPGAFGRRMTPAIGPVLCTLSTLVPAWNYTSCPPYFTLRMASAVSRSAGVTAAARVNENPVGRSVVSSSQYT